MSDFRTKFEVQTSSLKISHQDTLFFIGSCFTENIGIKLKELKLDVAINPFGIIYNPESISYLIQRLINGNQYSEDELIEKNGIWHNFDHHSEFSSTSKSACLSKINNSFELGKTSIRKCSTLFITFGSAHFYHHKTTDRLVSNCHKYSSSSFDKMTVDLNYSIEKYNILFNKLKLFNPELRVILTVSPVRYLSDGFIENQKSKSILHLLCQNLKNNFDWVEYFPAYEIMMDDLRDYRFYAEDMIHPSELAVNYIFDVFKQTYFSNESLQLLADIELVVKASKHRVFFEGSEEHQKFCLSMMKKIENLKMRFPFLDFQREMSIFSKV